jgi:hypothetical protein
MAVYKVLAYSGTAITAMAPFMGIFSTTSASLGGFSSGIVLLIAAGIAYAYNH